MIIPQPQIGNELAGVGRVYLNGEFMHAAQAWISPFDRGFIFGDGIYEVVPVFGGRLFRLQQHLLRLSRSLAAIGLENPLSDEAWRGVLQRLVDETGASEQSVYLQVTRGVAPRNHAYPKHIRPTVFAYAQPTSFPGPDAPAAGVAVITTTDIRWHRCDIKSTSLLGAVMLREQAVQRGSVEAILIRGDIVTEGAASNLFIVRAGTVITPPMGPFILPGITRDLVLELARRHALPLEERDISRDELFAAQELWITSSTQELKAVTRIDDKPVGDGNPGPLYRRMYRLYQDYKQFVREGKAE